MMGMWRRPTEERWEWLGYSPAIPEYYHQGAHLVAGSRTSSWRATTCSLPSWSTIVTC